MSKNVIISMTSWKGRITNVTRMLDTIWTNTVKPRTILFNGNNVKKVMKNNQKNKKDGEHFVPRLFAVF